jgi:hypothetical protein
MKTPLILLVHKHLLVEKYLLLVGKIMYLLLVEKHLLVETKVVE